MENKIQDWRVRLYGKNGKQIRTFVIKDRTEHEAQNESFNEVNDSAVHDWTMLPEVKSKKK